MTRFDWEHLLRQWFRVPDYSHVYVLGSFARHVTLYSQQVRALNLVTALYETGVLGKSRKVAVIGAGAAGLTAAVAAALKGADVTLIEESAGALAIQKNSRQRWLHPHIYDWPLRSPLEDESRLPVLPWSADDSNKVAESLASHFDAQVKGVNSDPDCGSIECHFRASNVHIRPGKQTTLMWSDDQQRRQDFAAIILAAGFGLEQKSPYSSSYWDDDDLDSSFRPDETWLVSGFGDGALTDLMRLCIRDFRHRDIAALFSRGSGIEGIKEELRQIHEDPRASDAGWLSDQFASLSYVDELVEDIRPRLQRRKNTVFLTGLSLDIYEPKASVLNRLILRILAQMGAFSVIHGPIVEDGITRVNGRYRVKFVNSPEVEVDGVVLRHGPQSKLKSAFEPIAQKSENLRARWQELPHEHDQTLKRLWQPGFYGSETKPAIAIRKESEESFNKLAERGGLKVDRLFDLTEVKEDGSARFVYQIDGLCATTERRLTGFDFTFSAAVGQIGPLELDDTAKQLKLIWVEDSAQGTAGISRDKGALSIKDALKKQRETGTRLSGTFKFSKPLRKDDVPLSFGFSFVVLNVYALSEWEFSQIYTPNERKHIDKKRIKNLEYAARQIWHPVRFYRSVLTLPNCCSVPRIVTFCSEMNVGAEIMIDDRGVVASSPRSKKNRSEAEKIKWSRCNSDVRLTDPAPAAQTSELAFDEPKIGYAYSLDWELPKNSVQPEVTGVVDKARDFRNQLMNDVREKLKQNSPGGLAKDVQRRLKKLTSDLRDLFGVSRNEPFDITLFTYQQGPGTDIAAKARTGRKAGRKRGDDPSCKLWLVDGVDKGKPVNPERREEWMPFGMGLAGACFKQGNRIFVYSRNGEEDSQPGERRLEYYIPFPGSARYECLIAVPLDHPDLTDELARKIGAERSRQCVGVICIGSSAPQSRIFDILADMPGNEKFIRTWALCQNFCSRKIQDSGEIVSATHRTKTGLQETALRTPKGWTRHTLGTFSAKVPTQKEVKSVVNPKGQQ